MDNKGQVARPVPGVGASNLEARPSVVVINDQPTVINDNGEGGDDEIVIEEQDDDDEEEEDEEKSADDDDDANDDSKDNKGKKRKKRRKKKKTIHAGYGLPPFPPCSYRFMPDFVAWLFGCYGYALGKNPYIFLALGIATGLAGAAGLYKIELATDSNALIDQFLEQDSRYISDDQIIADWKNSGIRLNSLSSTSSSFYHKKDKSLDANNNSTTQSRKKRDSDAGPCDWDTYYAQFRYELIIVVAKGNTLIDPKVMDEMFRLIRIIRETLLCDQDDSTTANTRFYCCDSWDIQRMKFEIFQGEKQPLGMSPGELMSTFFQSLTYPADKRFKLTETVFTNFIGGVNRSDAINGYNARVNSVKAMLFQYLMPNFVTTLPLESKLLSKMKAIRPQFKYFDIYYQTHFQLQREFLSQIVFQEMPKVGATFICVIAWCIVSSIHTDALNSKPWCGLAGICSTAFACAAGFGARFWSGDVFYTYHTAVPLMALAIGLDDMFILMNAWHETDVSMPRAERAKRTLQSGGTSIFVTVMMTIIDFVVGTATPYPAIQSYSNFALWVLAYDFWLQITIFVSILVLSDGYEKRKKHSFCHCANVRRRTYKNIKKWSTCHIVCCTFGRVHEDEKRRRKKKEVDEPPKEEKLYANTDELKTPPPVEPAKMEEEDELATEFSTGKKLIYDHVAPVVLHPVMRIIICILAVAFLAASVTVVWAKIRIGFRPEYLANRKSNTYDYNFYYMKYFKDFSDLQRLEVLFNFTTEPFNYNFTKIRKKIVEITERIEQFDSFIWGRRLNSVPIRDVYIANSSNVTLDDAISYINKNVSDRAMKPVIYYDNNDDERLITLATFQIKDVAELERGAELARRLKELQTSYERDKNFKMYITDTQQLLRVYDQIVNLPVQFIYFTFITVASTVVTAFVMIPHPICIFWMALSSMGIIVGTLAGMVLWGVGLDPVSLVYILMAIGATADYICHCIYTFTVIDAEMKPDEARHISWTTIRYRKARHLLAEVISETGPAAVGTTLSIVVLSTSNNYVLESFFKVFFCAVIVGLSFMCLVLPVVLCQFGPVSKICCEAEAMTEPVSEEVTSNPDEGAANTNENNNNSDNTEKIMPVVIMTDHVYENSNEQRRKLSRQQIVKVQPQRYAPSSAGSGGDPNPALKTRPSTEEDDYQILMRLRLLRRFLKDSRTFSLTANNAQDEPTGINTDIQIEGDGNQSDVMMQEHQQLAHRQSASTLMIATGGSSAILINSRKQQTRHFSLANGISNQAPFSGISSGQMARLRSANNAIPEDDVFVVEDSREPIVVAETNGNRPALEDAGQNPANNSEASRANLAGRHSIAQTTLLIRQSDPIRLPSGRRRDTLNL